jgi:hypothetical protein
MMLRTTPPAGPFESIELGVPTGDQLTYVVKHKGKTTLHALSRDFEAKGELKDVMFSPNRERVAWVEVLPDKKQRAVIDGEAGPACESVHNGIHFSPNSKHVAYVTRDGAAYKGWIDGREIRSDQMVVTARATSEGTPIFVEMWREKPAQGREVLRGRIVVDGKRQERVLARPVFNFDWQGDRLYGASRTDEDSVLVFIEPNGEVKYEDIKGRIGRILLSPDGGRRMFSVQTKEGYFVQIDNERRGPYERSDFFYLNHTKRLGYVADKGNKTLVVVEGKSTEVPLTDFAAPVRITDDEMTAAIVGVQVQKTKKEVWVRAIPLE